MSFELHRFPAYPGKAASAINGRQGVRVDVADVQRQFLPVASSNQELFGIAEATAASPGNPVTVYDQGHVVKVTAAASIGAGAEVAVASTNGNFGPGVGASGTVVYSAGVAQTAAAAGELFSLYVRPRVLSGTP